MASYAERCISHDRFCLSDRPSHAGIMQKDSSYDYGSSLEDSPMTLVSSWLTSLQNSKGNMGSEGTE